MLIDQIISDPDWRTRHGMTEDLRGRLSRAHKFTLARDFAIAADQFREDYDNLERGRQFCRLPFDECWIEVNQADRMLERNDPQPENTVKKKRIGFLLTNTDHQGAFEGRLFLAVDKTAVAPEATKNKNWWFTAPVDMHYNPHTATFDTAYTHRKVFSTELSDEHLLRYWQGETRYLTAALELLHAKNATSIVPADLTRLNRQRLRRNKPLLFDYHIVSIPQRYHDRNIASVNGSQAIRAHFVRGHFKARKTGIFFWSAFERGDRSLGFVHKDYVVGLPP